MAHPIAKWQYIRSIAQAYDRHMIIDSQVRNLLSDVTIHYFNAEVGNLFLVSLGKNSILTFQHTVIQVV